MSDIVHQAPLTAAIEIRAASPPAGCVRLTNVGDTDLRVWRHGNSWGDAALSFLLIGTNSPTTRITRSAMDYTRNVPASITLPPGGSYEVPFDLGDTTWGPVSAITQLTEAEAAIQGVYDSGDTPELRGLGIWQGEVRSASHPIRR